LPKASQRGGVRRCCVNLAIVSGATMAVAQRMLGHALRR
jgi:hypothetical protein